MKALYVLFREGDSHYVLPATAVLHMEAFEGVTHVRGTPPWVGGLVQVRRRVVPVVDLRQRFGLPPTEEALGARIVVVQDESRVVGLLADSAREVVHLGEEDFKPPPEVVAEQAAGFVKAVAHDGKRLLMVLDVHRVVGAEALVAPEAVAQDDNVEAEHRGE